MPSGVYIRTKSFSKESLEKMSKAKIGNTNCPTGENNHLWKGGISKDKKHRTWTQNSRNRLKILVNKNGSFHTQGEWENLKAQYNWTCPCCKRKESEIKLTEDHIIPFSRGGSDNIENIQPLCISCNCKKQTKIIKYLK